MLKQVSPEVTEAMRKLLRAAVLVAKATGEDAEVVLDRLLPEGGVPPPASRGLAVVQKAQAA